MAILAPKTTMQAPLTPPVAPKKRRRPVRVNFYRMVKQLPPASTLIVPDVSWREYEDLLEKVGEASGLRISYHQGELKIMTLSTIHESYALLLEKMLALLSVMRRVRIISFGSATIRKEKESPGAEPDCCFYVQSAKLIGTKIKLDFSQDPPPDVVVEIDVHHKSTDKFDIYAELGVPELWLYDQKRMRFYLLHAGQYNEVPQSQALPVLTSQILTDFLARSSQEDQYDTLLAFEDWLNALNT